MNKKIVLMFLAGWLFGLFFPPTRLTGMLKKSS